MSVEESCESSLLLSVSIIFVFSTLIGAVTIGTFCAIIFDAFKDEFDSLSTDSVSSSIVD